MNIQNKEQWDEAFIEACQKGEIEVVRHLCQKQYLAKGCADIHFGDELGFRMACDGGHVEVVKYLLTSPELIEAGHTFANLHAKEDEGFRDACRNGHLDVVKYLLTSPELIEAGHQWADVHARNELGFRWACNQEHWNVVRWLLMDYGLEKTSDIKNIVKDYPQTQEYFRAREEMSDLDRAMNPSLKNNGIVKLIQNDGNSFVQLIKNMWERHGFKKEARSWETKKNASNDHEEKNQDTVKAIKPKTKRL